MKIKIKIIRNLDEMSSMSGGAVHGFAGGFGDPETVDTFNKEQEREQRLKGDRLVEMYSTQGIAGKNTQQLVSAEEEHAGHVERSKAQGLKNVMQSEKKRTLKIKITRNPEK